MAVPEGGGAFGSFGDWSPRVTYRPFGAGEDQRLCHFDVRYRLFAGEAKRPEKGSKGSVTKWSPNSIFATEHTEITEVKKSDIKNNFCPLILHFDF